MKIPLSTCRSVSLATAMTLLELTVVIMVLLSLISILFIGARAWKRGSDRTGCILKTFLRGNKMAIVLPLRRCR